MRTLTLLSLLVLAGCAHLPLVGHHQHHARVAHARAGAATPSCRLDTVVVLEGRPGSAVVAAQALDLSGARTVRWIRPGAVVTTDFQPDRLDIKLTRDEIVKGFACG